MRLQVWVKTPQMLMRDRLVGTYQVGQPTAVTACPGSAASGNPKLIRTRKCLHAVLWVTSMHFGSQMVKLTAHV